MNESIAGVTTKTKSVLKMIFFAAEKIFSATLQVCKIGYAGNRKKPKDQTCAIVN